MDDTTKHDHTGHETTDISVGAVSRSGLVLAGGVVIVMMLMWFLFDVYGAQVRASQEGPQPSTLDNPQVMPPEPRLQALPRVEWSEYKVRQKALVEGYQWIDQQQGMVRIPVDRALEIVAREGLPKTPENWLEIQAQAQQQAAQGGATR
ncbi:MAG: hypothetical protein IPM24_01400 [Bryobacterales bacterium]|jgi:hypothetical protein|nr:hypothetical protein [Bryobacterales bacterium]